MTVEELTFHLQNVVRAKEDAMEDFNGPLDLILSLLAKNKMEIKDIQISLILDQYLAWMARRKELDLDVASEFVTMAAHLVYIKTRMLLSIHDEEAMSEMEQLIADLEQHQRHESYLKIQAVAPQLGERYLYGRDYITKVPEHLPLNKVYRYQHQPDDLYRAISQVMERLDNRMPPPMVAFEGIVGREPYPVGDKANEVLQRLPQRDRGHLFGGAGAVQGLPHPAGGQCGGLHRHLHRRRGGPARAECGRLLRGDGDGSERGPAHH